MSLKNTYEKELFLFFQVAVVDYPFCVCFVELLNNLEFFLMITKGIHAYAIVKNLNMTSEILCLFITHF